jgi:hypothetical protein
MFVFFLHHALWYNYAIKTNETHTSQIIPTHCQFLDLSIEHSLPPAYTSGTYNILITLYQIMRHGIAFLEKLLMQHFMVIIFSCFISDLTTVFYVLIDIIKNQRFILRYPIKDLYCNFSMRNILYKNCACNCLPDDEPMRFETCWRRQKFKVLPYFSIDNAHPKLFRHSFWCIDNAHDAN